MLSHQPRNLPWFSAVQLLPFLLVLFMRPTTSKKALLPRVFQWVPMMANPRQNPNELSKTVLKDVQCSNIHFCNIEKNTRNLKHKLHFNFHHFSSGQATVNFQWLISSWNIMTFSKHPTKKNTTTPTTRIQASEVASSFFGTLKPRIFTVLSMRPRISSTGGCPTKRAASPGWNEERSGLHRRQISPPKIPDTRSAQTVSPLPSFKPNPFEQKKGWFL